MEYKKNPESDIEKKKGALMVLGLVFATAFVLVMFEWKTFERGLTDLGELQLDLMEEEIIPVSLQTPPPPPPPPAPTTVIEIVDDEEELDEELIIEDLEVDEKTEIEFIEQVVENVTEEEVFTIVEQMPSFPGGEGELMKYLGNNIKYPAIARDAGIQGKVYVTFVVEKDGSVSDVKVLRGIGGGCDEEAVRVVKNMPKWSPGKQRGKPVKVQYNLPIRFTLK